MCLCEYHRFTFSNREAFDRLVRILNDEYGKYLPQGEIYMINGYKQYYKHAIKLEKNRNQYTYEELMEYLGDYSPPFTNWDYYSITNWEELEQTLNDIKDCKDVFGYIEVEVIIG